jgi:DNA mismatch endonuclease (patch repair protein)
MTGDPFTPKQRSAVMRAVPSQNSRPEMRVRKLVWSLGYRYRLHVADLPGKPDLSFPGRRACLFVHGCFWHGHDCRRGARLPKANAAYWQAKIARNKARDEATPRKLEAIGWKVMTIWECELADEAALIDRVRTFLK